MQSGARACIFKTAKGPLNLLLAFCCFFPLRNFKPQRNRHRPVNSQDLLREGAGLEPGPGSRLDKQITTQQLKGCEGLLRCV